MRVLVTGNKGRIGRVVEHGLKARGHVVVGFDVLDGKDIRDAEAIANATAGCDGVVHLAAEMADNSSDLISVNVLGTWNVLQASEAAKVKRVVCLSSVNALGVFQGQRAPDYLPIDDEHPCYPSSAYGMSKRLVEEMCQCFTARTGIPTICLRPPAVWTDEAIERIRQRRQKNPAFEWTPFWEYGCFIHVSDLADSTITALECPDPSHAVLLVNAPDISSASKTSRELADQMHPQVPWRGGQAYIDDPFRALMDTCRAQQVLGWSPRIRWRGSDR